MKDLAQAPRVTSEDCPHMRSAEGDLDVSYVSSVSFDSRGLALLFCERCGPTDQDSGWVMLTIQAMPNWSVHMPNSSPHICFSRGIVTVPPPESLSQ